MLSLDPGETTGWAVMCAHDLEACGQWASKDRAAFGKQLISYLKDAKDAQRPIHEIAYEDYKVYAWESEKHKWADLHTAKLIGVIELVAHIMFIPAKARMAHTAKTFVTDSKLSSWGLYVKGQRHARDAIRHAVYNQIFGHDKG